MAKLTSFGFERDNRTDIINKLSLKFKEKFGNDFLLTDDSLGGILLAIMAEGRLESEKLAEDVYYSRTFNGAEGIYLDDALSYYNFKRRGKIAGSGDVQINYTNSTTASSQTVDSTYTVATENGVTYSPDDSVILSQQVVGFYVDASTLSVGSYELSITNTETLEVVTESFSISTATTIEYENFAQSVIDFFLDNTSNNASFITRIGTEAYIGYNATQSFVAITEPTFFRTVPRIGELWSNVPVTANEVGFNELEQGGVTGLSPFFTGYLDATNTVDFYAGAENETDAEYRSRFEASRGEFPTGTRESLLDDLRELDGVSTVRIYDNPSLTDISEASAFTFNTVVQGGSNAEIAQTIYDGKPVNTLTSGTITIPVDTSDGDVEAISFTKASSYPADIKITYRLGNSTPLSSIEQNLVRESIETLFSDLLLGDVVYNTQLVSAVLSPLKANRLTSIVVETKRDIESDGSYGEDDINPLYYEFVELNNTIFNRII